MSELQRDRAGRRRSPATMPGFLAGRLPRNKGLRYPADPPKIEEIIAVMRAAGDGAHGRRLRALIVILWRAGCASKKRSRSPRRTSISDAARCSSAAATADGAGRSVWTTVSGESFSLGGAPHRPPRRSAVLGHQGGDGRPNLGHRGGTSAAPAYRGRG